MVEFYNTINDNTHNIMEGTIKKLTDRGYGFIGREGEDDLFFHANSVEGAEFDELSEGDEVTFETEESEKGLNAVNVQKAA